MSFPWEVVPRQRLAAWVLWLILMGGFLLACTISLLAALNLRQHPLVNTYFDTHVPIKFPDIQLCLATGDGPDTTVGAGPGPTSPYSLSIGCTQVSSLPHSACPVSSADISSNSRFPNTPVFIYGEKGEDGPGLPFLREEGSTMNTSSFVVDENDSVAPFGEVDNVVDRTLFGNCLPGKTTAILTGVNTQFACVTFYTSLCPAQPQASIVSYTGVEVDINPAFYLSLRGTGQEGTFKYLGLAVGENINEGGASGYDPANLYLSLKKNTTSTVVIAKHVRKSLRSLHPFKPNPGSEQAASYALERQLHQMESEAVGVTSSADKASFWLDLKIFFSPGGVVYQKEQDPLVSILATFGGYWPLVVLAFGLCFSVKDTPPLEAPSSAVRFVRKCMVQLQVWTLHKDC